MADTVTYQIAALATPPDATIVATDDAGAAGQVQIVKLAVATDGSAVAIPADANGLAVKQATAANLNMTEASAATIATNTGNTATAVAIMDDWDESDRAKVNVIAGQAGIAGGTGVDGATVPRVTLATNVGLPAGTNNIGDVDVLTTPGPSYVASAAQTQTNLDGLAASSTHVAGWESNAIDNSTNRYKDYRINAVLRTEGAAVTAGDCRMWLVAEMDDSTWPDAFDGTESAETVTDTEQRDAICRLAATSANDTGTAENIYLMCPSVAAVFGGTVPRKFIIFITQATGTTLETTGDPNQVYLAGVA